MASSILQISNETENSMSRLTTDGRKLTYELKVIQQPERARACGSGAKSSADRRPVDPPPVVELKIFEGEGEAKTDITFSHNANFFLFTTLENARPIAKVRTPATAPPTFPVLTGSPVAGMAYLDRPTQAGYFIFPDLSVRHEGLYRLSFSLFEELKEPKDADVEPPEGTPKTQDKLLNSNPMAPRAHVHFRLEVKSVPFAVYSAKKFPGLSESTPLSRTVAEQGCRVRIRRDVRMRRRDKPNEGYQGDYDDEPYARSERFGTPQHPPDRPRSISNGSIDVHTPYSTGRRSSIQDYFQQPATYTPGAYHQPHPPAPIQTANSYGPHLSFGASVSTPTFPPPQVQHQPAQSFVQNNNGYSYPQSVHARQISAPQTYGYHQPQQQLSSFTSQINYTQPQLYTENSEYRPATDHRRASATLLNQQSQPSSLASSMINYGQPPHVLQPSYYQSQPSLGSRTSTPIGSNGHGPPQLPPLRTDTFAKYANSDSKYELKSPGNNLAKPIVPSPYYTGNSYDSYAPPLPCNPVSTPDPLPARSTKRDYGTVFDTTHIQQPIHNGMRPNSADHGRDRSYIETDTGEVEDSYGNLEEIRSRTLVYKRADGSQQAKKCPSPIHGYSSTGYKRRR